MTESIRKNPGLKFLWSHQGGVHRLVVRLVNKFLNLIPFKYKYIVASKLKKTKIPYSLVEGLTVVQVGAPFDTLNAGRSRGMIFSLLVGDAGNVHIVEPLMESVVEMRKRLKDLGLENTTVHQIGAWSKKGSSFINVDRDHPATNFTESTVDYSEHRKSQFEKFEINLDTLDSILGDKLQNEVDLVSITTNWAEEEILQGMAGLLNSGVTYICLAYGENGETYERKLAQLGYKLLSHDDRGVTYKRVRKVV